MNLTNLAASLRKDMTTIKVFFVNDSGELSNKAYTYKCKREIAEKLETDDIVAVMACNRRNYRDIGLAIVHCVDEEPDIDLDGNTLLKWVICKVNIEEATNLQLKDEAVGKKLKAQKARNCREQALAMLGMDEHHVQQLLEDNK